MCAHWACSKKPTFLCHVQTLIYVQADDDTFVVVENLRYMVRNYDPSGPIWFGCKYRPYVENGYMSGGAGYVLSREALDRFVQNGLADNTGNSSLALSVLQGTLVFGW